MNTAGDIAMVLVLLSVLMSLASSRLHALVRIMAVQGLLVSLCPIFLSPALHLVSGVTLVTVVMVLIKGAIIPGLLWVALKRVAIRREVVPIIGYHVSLLIGLVIIFVSTMVAERLHLAIAAGRELFLITAVTTIAAGFFLMMGRRTALTQVIGYLMLENGIYLMGTTLTKASHAVYIIEFGVLLDLLVGVMIMGIIMHNINNAFDDITTDHLSRLKE
jgi:hydrogenase-4 component E